MSRSRSSTCACVVTSSAVVGSSAIRMRGSQASAIAIITRWRRPPLNWNGYSSTRRSGRGTPTMRRRSIARARASSLLASLCSRIDFHDLVADRVVVAERRHRLLEDERDLLAADRAHLRPLGRAPQGRSGGAVGRPRASHTSPASIRPGRSTMPRMLRAVMLLPQPLSPTMPSVRPANVEAHAVDRAHHAFVETKIGLQVADRQDRGVVRSRAHAL